MLAAKADLGSIKSELATAGPETAVLDLTQRELLKLNDTASKMLTDLDAMKNPTGKDNWAVEDLDEIKNNTFYTATKLDVLIGAALGGAAGAGAAIAEQAAIAAQKTADAAAKIAKAAEDQIGVLASQKTLAEAAAKMAEAVAQKLGVKSNEATAAEKTAEAKAIAAENAVKQGQSLTDALKKASDAADALYEANPTPENKQAALAALGKYIDATHALEAATKTATDATNAANQAKTAAQEAQKQYTDALNAVKSANAQIADLSKQITEQITAAAKAETAAEAAQAAAAQALLVAQQAASKVTPSGSPGSSSDVSSLAGFITAQFSTLENWLSPMFRSLLVPTGGQGLTVVPTLPTFGGSSPVNVPPSQTTHINITTQFNGPVYGGQNAMQQMTRDMGDTLIAQFRRAGMKF